MADYNKIGLLTASDGRILLCRKKHTTSLLILPGGCLEPGESAMDCLHRELREELGEQVSVKNLEYVGTYSDRAAGSDYKIVEIELYRGDLTGEPRAQAEIKELVWFGQADDRSQLSPSIVNKILPDLAGRGLLPWQAA